jgi:hypothetical protein
MVTTTNINKHNKPRNNQQIQATNRLLDNKPSQEKMAQIFQMESKMGLSTHLFHPAQMR